MFSRVSFEIVKRASFHEPALMALIMGPADYNDIRGEVKVASSNRYRIVVEAPRDNVLEFMSYLEYGSVAFGELVGIHITHHHECRAFSRGFRMVFPE